MAYAYSIVSLECQARMEEAGRFTSRDSDAQIFLLEILLQAEGA